MAEDIESAGNVRLVELLEGGGSSKDAMQALEETQRFWLTGLAYGYPVWSTVQFYLTMRQQPPAAVACDECCGGSRKRDREDDMAVEAVRCAVEVMVEGHHRDSTTLPTVKRVLHNLLEHPEQQEKYGTLKKSKPRVANVVCQPKVMALLRLLGFKEDTDKVWLGQPCCDEEDLRRVLEEIEAEERVFAM